MLSLNDDTLANTHEQKWNLMFNELLKQLDNGGIVDCEEENHPELSVDAKKLMLWLNTQRQAYRKGTLRPDRLEKLKELVDAGKISWGSSRGDDQHWNIMFAALSEYAEVHGQCNVLLRQTITLEDEVTVLHIGRWLDGQRQLKKRGKLRPDREAKLQWLVDHGKLRWGFEGEDDKKWMLCYNALLALCEANGDVLSIPQSYETVLEDGTQFHLGLWITHQKHRRKLNTLRQDRYELLQALVNRGKFRWSEGGEVRSKLDRWTLAYDAMIAYGDQHNGSCNVPRSYECILADGNSLKLGMWLHSQRDFVKKGKLPADRLAKLKALCDEGKLAQLPTPDMQNQPMIHGMYRAVDMAGAPHGFVAAPQMHMLDGVSGGRGYRGSDTEVDNFYYNSSHLVYSGHQQPGGDAHLASSSAGGQGTGFGIHMIMNNSPPHIVQHGYEVNDISHFPQQLYMMAPSQMYYMYSPNDSTGGAYPSVQAGEYDRKGEPQAKRMRTRDPPTLPNDRLKI